MQRRQPDRWLPASEGGLIVQVNVGRPDVRGTAQARLPRSARAVTGEPAPVWRKSSHSGPSGNCVEVAWRQGAGGINVLVRDSKFPGQDALIFTPGEWAAFLERAKAGEFDSLAHSVFVRVMERERGDERLHRQ